MKLIADTHSHTLASGHAYSTIREMARAAFEKGMEAFAITEHGPKMPDSCGRYYFNNLRVVPRKLEGVELFLGVEANLMNPEGTLDLREDILKQMDIVIASIHVPCYGMEHTEKENTNAYLKAMENPYVHVIGHPDDGRFPVDYEMMVKKAKETHTLIEVNNSSLSPIGFRKDTHKNMKEILTLCKQYEACITTSSDAHIDVDAANFCYVEEILRACDFPEELVATTNLELLKSFLNCGEKDYR
nr:phosphatase [uncultured Mediterraneibacter sp.]